MVGTIGVVTGVTGPGCGNKDGEGNMRGPGAVDGDVGGNTDVGVPPV